MRWSAWSANGWIQCSNGITRPITNPSTRSWARSLNRHQHIKTLTTPGLYRSHGGDMKWSHQRITRIWTNILTGANRNTKSHKWHVHATKNITKMCTFSHIGIHKIALEKSAAAKASNISKYLSWRGLDGHQTSNISQRQAPRNKNNCF